MSFNGELSPLILRDIKEKELLLSVILLLLLDLRLCSFGCLLLCLLKDYFLAFSTVSVISLLVLDFPFIIL